jgi:HSP20 family molecular chaperone IbpA
LCDVGFTLALYRSTIGFDRLFSMQDQVPGREIQNYPPHNIERIDENSYRRTVAAAGFSVEGSLYRGEGKRSRLGRREEGR